MAAMPTREEARSYLDEVLNRERVEFKTASLAIGKGDSYIQQYIRYGKPSYLHEPEREALIRLWPFIDGERLKPPLPKPKPSPAANRKRPASNGDDKPKIDAPRLGELIDQPGALDLLEAFRGIRQPEMRQLALTIIQGLADTSSTMVG